MALMDWFTVDKKGLAKLLERRGKAFAIFELIQNAWDTRAKKVDVVLSPIAGQAYAHLVVTDDDPDGFKDLAQAFTLFAESDKKGCPEKRGRFNLGEKLVLALCRTATISSTTGTVFFDKDGRRTSSRKTTSGSTFEGEIRMTRTEYQEVVGAVKQLLPPVGTDTFFNGERLSRLPVRAAFMVYLPTEIADEEGYLRKVERTTPVQVYEPGGEVGKLYELGIPVVETGDRWHVNICQKIPLNTDRDNVTPAYLQKVRAAVLNHLATVLEGPESAAPWVRDAMAHPSVTSEAVGHVMQERFGEKRVIADPSDVEGTKLAVSKGYTVIPGGALSGAEWENVRRAGAALPAGQVTPSPKPFSPDGAPLNVIPQGEWSMGMLRAVLRAKRLGKALLDVPEETMAVTIVNNATWPFAAVYSPGQLIFNAGRLGRAWFDDPDLEPFLELVIHEFGHHFSGDHLSEHYHDALCKLGARLAVFLQTHTIDLP
jgi:hypothetical protein